MKTLQEARQFFAADRFATENGMIIESVEKNHAVISLGVAPRHRNAAGGLMGGVSFTMSDFACAVAANFAAEDGLWVSVDSAISFVNGLKGCSLTAEAVLIKEGRSTAFYRVDVTDDEGMLITTAKFTMSKIFRKPQ